MINVIGRISADVENGGWEASGEVFGDADSLDFDQNIKAWYNLYADGWEAEPRSAFNGHLSPEPWQKTFQTSIAPWKAYTAHEMMKRGDLQGIYFKDEATPANRHQIIDQTFAKIVYEIVTGHCNLVQASDGTAYDSDLWGTAFTTPTYEDGFLALNIDFDSSAAIAAYEIKAGSFWSKLQELAKKEFYTIYTDKTNTLNYIPHPMFAASLPDPVITLTSDLLLEPLRIERRNTSDIGQVLLYGSDPSGSAITGVYPTDPNPGPIKRRGGYLCDSGSALTNMAERSYLYDTREYTVTASVGNGVGLMLELLDRVAITYSSAADGVSWSDEAFYVHKIDVEIMSDFQTKTVLTLEQENTGA